MLETQIYVCKYTRLHACKYAQRCYLYNTLHCTSVILICFNKTQKAFSVDLSKTAKLADA